MADTPDILPSQTGFSIGARFKSFIFAWRGLRWLVHTEHNARVHLAASMAAVFVGLFLGISPGDWRWIFLAMAMVWLAEAFNTAIEKLCDRIEPEFDPAIGRIKDVSAGAVLIASITAALIGFLTLWPPILALLT
jgi:diacylglycerol kinase (ATP)